MKVYIGMAYDDGKVRQIECNPDDVEDLVKIISDLVKDEKNVNTFEITVQIKNDD